LPRLPSAQPRSLGGDDIRLIEGYRNTKRALQPQAPFQGKVANLRCQYQFEKALAEIRVASLPADTHARCIFEVLCAQVSFNDQTIRIGTEEQMPSLAQALIGDKPNATIAISDWALHATRAATKTIPIVAAPMSADPVIAGVAESWAHRLGFPSDQVAFPSIKCATLCPLGAQMEALFEPYLLYDDELSDSQFEGSELCPPKYKQM
jgi:hypothetical protein